MKITNLFLILFLSLNSYFIFSQESIETSIIDPFQEDALYREKVFIHANKTTYFANENIWFTAYVAKDADNTPSEYTSNLYVNLLNAQGDVIASKNIFIKDGIGEGDFLIPNNITSGFYYIQGFTNFMRNFGKENVYIQEIKIINQNKKIDNTSIENSTVYDIQVFPESGYLLEDAMNTLGIKALINGKGDSFKGILEDTSGNEITSFKGNIFGMTKCKFFYKTSETYTAVIHINETIQRIKIPKAKKTGVVFNIDNNSDFEQVKLTLITNNATLPSLKNHTLSILIYRNNHICEATTLTFKNNHTNTTIQELFFDKQKMLDGVNMATLFKNNQPLAERAFFIDKATKQTAISFEKLTVVNDSIIYKIKTLNTNFKPIVAHLSIAVLPEKSNVFHEKQHIKSAFLLSPYVKGIIENPAYYFDNSNINRKEFLDLLLLNQGWSKYLSFSEKVKEINPKKEYDFESGFTLNGAIKKIPKGYDIGLLSKKNKLTGFSKFNENNEFQFENIFAYKNDTAKVTLIKKNKPLKKPIQIAFTAPTFLEQNYNYLTNLFFTKNNAKNKSTFENTTISNFYHNAELLDDVVLKNIQRKRQITNYEKEMNIAFERKIIGAFFYKNIKVTEKIEGKFNTVLEYFTNLGFIKLGPSGEKYLILRTAPITFHSKYKKMIGNIPPKVYINNVATPLNDIELLESIKMLNVDEILINKSGAGEGINGMGGAIKIYLKNGNHRYYEDKSKKLYTNLLLLTGFDRVKQYYKPLYNIYTKNSFNWTEIDWKNSIQTNEKGEVLLKIPINEFSNKYQFVINGFSKNGLLFHTIYKSELDNF